MYLKAMKLINFGGHRQSYITFPQGGLSIYGDNDAGKSRIQRAFEIAAFNGDFPERLIHREEKKAAIHLELANGRTLIRRCKGDNALTFIYEDGTTKDFKNIKGTDADVEQFLGIGKVKLDENEKPVNMHIVPLFATPFLLDKGPDKLFRALSYVVAGKGLEEAKNVLGKRLNARNNELAIANGILTSKKQIVANMDLARLVEAEAMLVNIKAREVELGNYKDTIAWLKECNDVLALEGDVKLAEQKLDKIKLAKVAIAEKQQRLAEYKESLKFIKDSIAYIADLEEKQTALASNLGVKQATIAEKRKEIDNMRCATCNKLVTYHD